MHPTIKFLKLPPKELFWSEPSGLDSDFKKEDPLALDYLGQQVGRWLFSGFTTRTNRAQYYAVVLYGLHLAELAIRRYGYPGDDKMRIRLFERWERFWALATLQYHNGFLERGHEDTMRGIRGATQAWVSAGTEVPLDFRLISRQSELGGLGAYLSSLRKCELVFPGTIRVTPVARDIVNSFWPSTRERSWTHLYEEYALRALNLEYQTICRTSGRITLAGIGKRSRLSSLLSAERTAQQERLWKALFVKVRDGSTYPLATQLISANEDGVSKPEKFLEELLVGRWGQVPSDVFRKAEIALSFGRLACKLLDRFDRAYGYVNQNGWTADFDSVVEASFPANEISGMRRLCNAVLSVEGIQGFRELQFHGRSFIRLVETLANTDGRDSLIHLLDYHRRVQRSRRGGGAWLRRDREKLMLQLAGYSGYKWNSEFPEFKLNVVRQLLADLGKLG